MCKKTTPIICRFSSLLLVFIIISCGSLFNLDEAQAANFPLEITQPRPGLTTLNRYYKAYPGLEYNVRPAVVGGAYPYSYSLTTKPTGMVINSSTGTISWPSPPVGGPYTVTLSVKDAENTTVTMSWQVTVTTAGFLFVDAVNGRPSALNGGTGTGTQANPFKTLKDVYEGNDYNAKSKKSYAGQFVYFRSGTYNIDTFIENIGTVDERTPFTSDSKPLVWLSYPNETPIIDFKRIPAFIAFYSNSPDRIYIDGLTLVNMSSAGFKVQSNAQGVFRRLTMHDLGPTTGNNNQSFIMTTGGLVGYYTVIQDNIFYNLNHGAVLKIYGASKMLIEDNILHDVTDTLGGSLEGIALKASVMRTTVRGNTIYNIPNEAIGGNGYNYYGQTADNEFCFNYIYNVGNYSIYQNQEGANGATYIYRNTLTGKVYLYKTTTGTGPFYISNNVIISNDKGIYSVGTTGAASVVTTDNLVGTPSSVIIDDRGNLTSAYSQFIGTRGWQTGISVGGSISPPSGIKIQQIIK